MIRPMRQATVAINAFSALKKSMVINQQVVMMLTQQPIQKSLFATGFRSFSSNSGVKNMYFGHVPQGVSEEEFRAAISSFNHEPTKVNLVPKRDGDGYIGFVDFETEEAAKAVLDATNGKITIKGQSVECAAGRERGHKDSKLGKEARTLYCGNLDYNVEEWRLEEFFSEIGVDRITIPKSPEGRARGFAFIQFNSVDDAERALERSGEEIDGRTISLRKAQPAAKREERPDRGNYRERY